MRLASLLLFALGCGGSPPVAATPPSPPSVAAAKVLVAVDEDGVGLGGNDPVAYHLDGEVAPGAPELTSAFGGATYRFTTTEHKAAFDADMAKHVPQYGGYCAFAASQNRLQVADPTVFQIIDGQLFVFTDASFKTGFNQDVPGNKAKADQYWPGLVAKFGK